MEINTLVMGYLFPLSNLINIALFKNKPRNASVKAITFCHLYYLDKQSFDLLIPKYPSIAKNIEAKVLERVKLNS